MKKEHNMNKIQRAVIMAAGMGTRMLPLTRKIPKPLVPVHGAPMIETVINALHANGIDEIYIVTGHLGEQFEYLPRKYQGIILLQNPYYKISNNISSLYAAREYLENAMILDGDQVIYNPAILAPEFKQSGYNAVWIEHETNEWLMTVKNGTVKSCSKTGGNKGWQLYSISRWSKADGQKLRRHLETEFEEKKNIHIYWDDLALFCYPAEYQLGIFKMQKSDVIEIDGLDELAAADPVYRKLLEEIGFERKDFRG